MDAHTSIKIVKNNTSMITTEVNEIKPLFIATDDSLIFVHDDETACIAYQIYYHISGDRCYLINPFIQNRFKIQEYLFDRFSNQNYLIFFDIDVHTTVTVKRYSMNYISPNMTELNTIRPNFNTTDNRLIFIHDDNTLDCMYQIDYSIDGDRFNFNEIYLKSRLLSSTKRYIYFQILNNTRSKINFITDFDELNYEGPVYATVSFNFSLYSARWIHKNPKYTQDTTEIPHKLLENNIEDPYQLILREFLRGFGIGFGACMLLVIIISIWIMRDRIFNKKVKEQIKKIIKLAVFI
ncbi:hypothetical protein RF11_09335 [Thelohanellus kitauei]|uniref:Uncharacterized protein n=1 Tax=Thelohanellus kitauei TaxID=669202 RepID=A0A0C2MR30_THEKT|nr:hypothetical protein RF11_09335 [Thelohanellus kitauei]